MICICEGEFNEEEDNDQKLLKVIHYINNLTKLAVSSQMAYHRLNHIRVASSVEFKIADEIIQNLPPEERRKWQYQVDWK